MVKLICLLKNDKYVEYGKTYEGHIQIMFGTELWIIEKLENSNMRGDRRAYNLKDFTTISELRDKRINDILND